MRRMKWIVLTVVVLLGAASSQPLAAESVHQSFEVVAVIEPELSLTVEPQTGERLDLGLIYSSPSVTRFSKTVQVKVRVFSNLGRPYQVTHQLLQPLMNQEGETLPPEDLLFSELNEIQPTGPSPVGTGMIAQAPQTVLWSDPEGQSVTRSVAYQLRVPPGRSAGTYRGTVLMTVTAQ